jgi:hypothetical protein
VLARESENFYCPGGKDKRSTSISYQVDQGSDNFGMGYFLRLKTNPARPRLRIAKVDGSGITVGS